MKYKVTIKVILDYERRIYSSYGSNYKSVCDVFILSEVVEMNKRHITRDFINFQLGCLKRKLEVSGWVFKHEPELLEIMSIEKVPKDVKVTEGSSFNIEGIVEQDVEVIEHFGFYESKVRERIITNKDEIREML